MTETFAFFQKGLLLVVWLSLPPLSVAVLIGILVSLVQTALSVQDQALPFAFKLIAVGLVLAGMGRWVGIELLTLGEQALDSIPRMAHHGRTSS
jgi:type III secretion protein S